MAWLYKRGDSRKWWIGWRVNGRQFLQSTGTENKAEAQRKLDEFNALQEWKRAGRLTTAFIESLTGEKAPAKKTFAAELESWLTETSGSASKATLRRYTEVGTAFAKYLKATEKGPFLDEIDSDTARSFLVQRRATASASTVNLWRKILSIFFGRALKAGVIQRNPVALVKVFKPSLDEKTARRAFTLEELRVIYGNCPDAFWRYMVLAGFFTGLRLGDLATLTWGSVDFPANGLRVQTRKTGKPVFIPLRTPLRAILEDLNSRRTSKSPTGALWPEQAALYEKDGAGPFGLQFHDILAASGLVVKRTNKAKSGRSGKREAGVSFHCLRHSFVTTLAVVDGSKSVAKALAGHSSEMISDLYTHLPVETLAAAVAKLPDITKESAS